MPIKLSEEIGEIAIIKGYVILFPKLPYKKALELCDLLYKANNGLLKHFNSEINTDKNEKTGEEKISHQKLMDGKGTKVIKKMNLNSGDKEEHSIYQGIKEENMNDFNKKYNKFKEKVKLDEMFEKVKLLGKKRNLEKGKVLLLGDGNENKVIEEETKKDDIKPEIKKDEIKEENKEAQVNRIVLLVI